MDLTHARILVTGADGFIGSHLVEHLITTGHTVRPFVWYNSFNSWGWLDTLAPEVRRDLDVFSGDIRDPHGVRTAMQGCDVVLHLAALIAIPYSYHSPASYVDTNITGTLNVLMAARELEVERIVHTSTSEVYGTARYVPIDEEHPLQGQSPYSATKIGADQLALSFHRSFQTPVAVIRPFNTYGPRQSARAVIPTILTQLLTGHTTLKLGATRPTRDFNYVQDTVRGFLAVAAANAALGTVINIGSNYEISVGDTVRLLAEEVGVDATIECEAERLRPAASEVERLWAANARAKELTGWEPAYGGKEGFRRGLQETIAWFRQPENLARYKPDMYNV